jgi:hypothetical protein
MDVSIIAIWHYLQMLGYGLSGLTVIGFMKIGYDAWRGGRFIALVLSDVPVGRTKAYRKMLTAFWHAKTLMIDFKAPRLAAARYIAELEILMPDLKKPNEADYDSDDYKRLLADWNKLDEQHKQLKRDLFQSHFESRRLGVAKWLWRSIRRSLSKTKEKARTEEKTNIIITDIPSLDDSRTSINHYFDALEELRVTSKPSFISTVEFRFGYLAPLFLITGLINRFGEEEGWQLILENYRRLIERDSDAYSAELVELRSFLFNCWLLWGPSISPCDCKCWRPTHEGAKNSIVLQYGFGDENNSIDVLIEGKREVSERILDRLNSPRNRTRRDGFNPIAIMAAPFVIKGTFTWGPVLEDGEVPPAQELIRGGTIRPSPRNGRIVLRCAERDVTSNTEKSSKYYSAYLWIMFSIETMDGKPFFPFARWKNLLVYFEHGNIADPTTFQTLKESLVTKACSSIAEILNRKEDQGRLRIRYACSLDDSYCCPQTGILFPPEQGILEGPDARKKETRLVDIMADMIRRHPEAVLRSDRLLMPNAARPHRDNPYSSCSLPEIVEEFYRDLRNPAAPPAAVQASPQALVEPAPA